LKSKQYKLFRDLDIAAIEVGDILRYIPSGWSMAESWASYEAFTPHVRWIHHIIAGPYVAAYNNRVIGQSTPAHGVNIRWLSDYNDYPVSVLRFNRWDSKIVGQAAWDALPFEGLRPYGYMSILKLIEELFKIEYTSWKVNHKLKSVTPYEVNLGSQGLICTQLLPDVYGHAGVAILPDGCAAIPAAYQLAVEQGILVEV
jgi:hypothetical protein